MNNVNIYIKALLKQGDLKAEYWSGDDCFFLSESSNLGFKYANCYHYDDFKPNDCSYIVVKGSCFFDKLDYDVVLKLKQLAHEETLKRKIEYQGRCNGFENKRKEVFRDCMEKLGVDISKENDTPSFMEKIKSWIFN